MSTLNIDNNNNRIRLQPMKTLRQKVQIRVLDPSLVTPPPTKKIRLEARNESSSSSPCIIRYSTRQSGCTKVRSSSSKVCLEIRPRTEAGVQRRRPAVRIMSKRNTTGRETSRSSEESTTSPVPLKKALKCPTETTSPTIPSHQTGAVNTKNDDSFVKKSRILDMLEYEFTCCICNELMIEPTITRCNHMFCAHCLKECKKKCKLCPFCRQPRMSERPIKSLDAYINAMLQEFAPAEFYAERLKLIEKRAEKKPARKSRTSLNTSAN